MSNKIIILAIDALYVNIQTLEAQAVNLIVEISKEQVPLLFVITEEDQESQKMIVKKMHYWLI